MKDLERTERPLSLAGEAALRRQAAERMVVDEGEGSRYHNLSMPSTPSSSSSSTLDSSAGTSAGSASTTGSSIGSLTTPSSPLEDVLHHQTRSLKGKEKAVGPVDGSLEHRAAGVRFVSPPPSTESSLGAAASSSAASTSAVPAAPKQKKSALKRAARVAFAEPEASTTSTRRSLSPDVQDITSDVPPLWSWKDFKYLAQDDEQSPYGAPTASTSSLFGIDILANAAMSHHSARVEPELVEQVVKMEIQEDELDLETEVDELATPPPAPPVAPATLLEIYQSLVSPITRLEQGGKTIEQVWEDVVGEKVIGEGSMGVRTKLMRFQVASVLKMWKAERAASSTFLLGASTPTPKQVPLPQGGVLAETMGVGKTLMCLALILSTLGELAEVEEVLTPASESFGGPAYAAGWAKAQVAFEDDGAVDTSYQWEYERKEMRALEVARDAARQEQVDQLTSKKVPTLRDLALHVLSTSSLSASALSQLRSSRFDHLRPAITANQAFYFEPAMSEAVKNYTRRGRQQLRLQGGQGLESPRILVSRTSLVVVPRVLIKQWLAEIGKHVGGEKQGVEVVNYSTLGGPEKDELESEQQEESKGARLRVLVIDILPSTAAAATSVYVRQMPSKNKKRRAIINEAGALEKDILVSFDIVLISALVFARENEVKPRSVLEEVEWKRIIVDEGHVLGGKNNSRALASRIRATGRFAVTGTPTKNLRGEQQDADEDLESALLPSQVGPNGFKSDITRLGGVLEFIKAKFTLPHDPADLKAVLEHIVVKHTPDAIQQEIQLPPLRADIVRLRPGRLELLTSNALRALFVLNSIDSDRTDQDYLFHPKQKDSLKLLSENLALSGFFFGSTVLAYNLRTSIRNVTGNLLTEEGRLKFTHKVKSRSLADRKALFQAFEHIYLAISDKVWTSQASAASPLVETSGPATQVLQDAWTGIAATESSPISYSSNQLSLLRGFFKHEREQNPDQEDSLLIQRMIALGEREKLVDKEPLPKRQRRNSAPTTPISLPLDSPFRSFTLRHFTSAKINFVLDELTDHPLSKFLVFCSVLPDLELAVLSTALELAGVSHAVLGAGAAVAADEAVHRFVSSDAASCQALLIQTSMGGRGLDLTMATRVIFLEPIWDPDLEAQAARRAHRLGQRHEVVMKTLVISGGFEEKMLDRRREVAQRGETKARTFQEDSTLRQVLQEADFLADPVDLSRKVHKTPEKKKDREVIKKDGDSAAPSKPAKRRKRSSIWET